MPPNRIPELSYWFAEQLEVVRRMASLQPLVLGGSSGPGGGTGTRPGGILGVLPQNRLAYDSTEASDITGGSTLLDNFNHLRARASTVVPLWNRSGASLSHGDVVVVDLLNPDAVKTTTAPNAMGVTGVALSDASAGSQVYVTFDGFTPRVRLDYTGAIGDYISTSATAGRAAFNGTGGSDPSIFGMIIESGSTPAAILFNVNKYASGGGGGGIVSGPPTQVPYFDSFSHLTSGSDLTFDPYYPRLTARGSLVWNGILTPPDVTGDVNDFDPTGGSGAAVYRLHAIGDIQFNGLAGGVPGRVLTILLDPTSGNMNINNLSGASLAQNQIVTPGTQSLFTPQGGAVTLLYDIDTHWHVVAWYNPLSGGDLDGTWPNVGVRRVSGYLAFTNPITDTPGVDQNDYNPTGLNNTADLRVNASAPINITGLVALTGGMFMRIHSLGSAITLTAYDGASAAANQFAFPANVTLNTDESISLWYDGTSAKWRKV